MWAESERECLAMDLAKALDDLALTERAITEGQARVKSQAALIEELKADGHDTTSAVQLLHMLERSLQLHIESKELILAELNEMGWVPDAG
jgi:hypothetical protein